MRCCYRRHPIAHGLIDRIAQGLRARRDRFQSRSEQLHTEHIGRLTAHILGAHVDHAFDAIVSARGGRGDTVLAGSRFRNDAPLAHALGKQHLAQRVVDFVRSGVVEIFALEPNLRSTASFRQAFGEVDWRWAAHVIREQFI